MTIMPKVAPPTAKEEAEAYEIANDRDQNRCVRCGSFDGVQRDHRKNRSQGGLTLASNLQLLCARCHLWKTDHHAEAVEEGWAVPMRKDPAQWPARRQIRAGRPVRLLSWVLYNDRGGMKEIPAVDAYELMGRIS
ncbi:HNH endonuclease signature motif containing protein [Herbiconiux sp. KACC 21604]|uniref:HNH endonuclease n=1 Tax=unclassified Herbiconiux TaxID=2618217 RepID=UPI001490F467|nr:HNH endonuclease signature motif containing protein [Herbiconiux sp. SALV-R1]QJU52952.1 HNH endonuclease [Herbiconiux sp. SALV-R1]WPO87875.1 HNH endonuclease signature motif containing protein [Herbiconiux sp. KACC 21604]